MTRTFAEQIDSIYSDAVILRRFLEAPMIDLKSLEDELQQCRLARLDAEAAEREVEELLWEVQHFEPGKQRMLFIFECGDTEIAGVAN